MAFQTYFKEYLELRYWVHLSIILAIVFFLMKAYNPQNVAAPFNFAVWLLYLAIGDITADKITGY